jgi:hypothetical protein
MAGKRRKPGEWEAVARGRAKIERYTRTTRGLTNIPNMGETGSAAYRRLQAKLGGKRK